MKIHYHSLTLTSLFALSLSFSPVNTLAALPLKLDLTKANSTQLTVYPEQTLVSQSFTLRLPKHLSKVIIPVNVSFCQLDTLALTASTNAIVHHPTAVSWLNLSQSQAAIMATLLGKSITVSVPKSNLAIKGTLIYWHNNMGVLKASDGQMTLFNWQSDLLVTTHFSSNDIDQFTKTIAGQHAVSATFNLPSPATKLAMSYINNGVSLQNTYRIVWQPTQNNLNLSLGSTITNHSNITYPHAQLTLASNTAGHRPPVYNQKVMALASESSANRATHSRRNGNQQFITVEGKQTIPSHSSVSINLLTLNHLSGHYQYAYTFNGDYATSSSTREHPQSSIIFKAPEDLPSGQVQLYSLNKQGIKQLVANSRLFHAAEGAEVRLPLGSVYTVDVSRKRLSVQHAGKERGVQWELTLVNHKKTQVALAIRDTSTSLLRITGNLPVSGDTIKVSLKPGEKKVIDMTSIYLQDSDAKR